MNFTIEEENLICIFDVSSRNACITEISAAMEEFEVPELYEIANNILLKLKNMSDAEFSALEFNPIYFDDETEEV
jgi:hypothetical protein